MNLVKTLQDVYMDLTDQILDDGLLCQDCPKRETVWGAREIAIDWCCNNYDNNKPCQKLLDVQDELRSFFD